MGNEAPRQAHSYIQHKIESAYDMTNLSNDMTQHYEDLKEWQCPLQCNLLARSEHVNSSYIGRECKPFCYDSDCECLQAWSDRCVLQSCAECPACTGKKWSDIDNAYAFKDEEEDVWEGNWPKWECDWQCDTLTNARLVTPNSVNSCSMFCFESPCSCLVPWENRCALQICNSCSECGGLTATVANTSRFFGSDAVEPTTEAPQTKAAIATAPPMSPVTTGAPSTTITTTLTDARDCDGRWVLGDAHLETCNDVCSHESMRCEVDAMYSHNVDVSSQNKTIEMFKSLGVVCNKTYDGTNFDDATWAPYVPFEWVSTATCYYYSSRDKEEAESCTAKSTARQRHLCFCCNA